MKYIVIHENKVTEIIPEIDSRFPGVSIEKRFAPDFLTACVKVEDDTAVSVGMVYKDDKFAEPEPVPTPPEVIEPATADTVMLALADLDARREADKLENQLAIAELAEKLTAGGVTNG